MASQNVSAYRFPQLDGAAASVGSPAEVVAAAQAEAAAIREEARSEGLSAGRAEGLQQARVEIESALAAARQAHDAILGTREELVEKLTRQAGELALQIAERIVGEAFAGRPERVVETARGALRRLSTRHQVTVLVNPDDLELMERAAGELKAELGGIEHLDVQADRRVQRGGAVAQTTYGEIDASISAQLDSARELVVAALDGDPALAAPEEAGPETDHGL